MTSSLFSLDGRVALVTGASRGLGLAMAEGLAESGATVVLNGRDPKTLAACAKTLTDRKLKADFLAFDVTDEMASRKGVDDVAAKYGKLDIFIANAGMEPAASAAAIRTRLAKMGNPRRAGRVAEWPWGRFAVVTRSSRIKTSGDYARETGTWGSNFVSRT